MEPLPHLPLNQIIQNCQEQTANFLRKRISDTQYCYELFRRAIVDRNHDALNALYENYRLMIEGWANRHTMLILTNETAQYFALEAFRAFQLSMRPERMANFPDVGHFLSYLASCVDTKIKQYVRRYPLDELMQPDQDFVYTEDFEGSIELQKLWAYVCEVLDDKNSILLAQCLYIYQMKPQEIVEHYPQIWPTPNDVRVHGQRIKRKLHGNSRLRGWGQQ